MIGVIPWPYGLSVRCWRCLDARWVPLGRGRAIPCPDCQPGAAVLALKRGSRR